MKFSACHIRSIVNLPVSKKKIDKISIPLIYNFPFGEDVAVEEYLSNKKNINNLKIRYEKFSLEICSRNTYSKQRKFIFETLIDLDICAALSKLSRMYNNNAYYYYFVTLADSQDLQKECGHWATVNYDRCYGDMLLLGIISAVAEVYFSIHFNQISSFATLALGHYEKSYDLISSLPSINSDISWQNKYRDEIKKFDKIMKDDCFAMMKRAVVDGKINEAQNTWRVFSERKNAMLGRFAEQWGVGDNARA